jgi:hypothetical protein
MIKLMVQVESQESTLMWHHIVKIPEEVSSTLIEGSDGRVVCHLPGNHSFHCALQSDGEGGRYILINQDRRKLLDLQPGEVFEIGLEKDRSEFGMPMSQAMQEVLFQEEEALSVFMSLTPGKQRSLIYWSDNVKSTDIKIRRALVLVRHLKSSQGAIDFKQLNEEMKRANQAAKGLS